MEGENLAASLHRQVGAGSILPGLWQQLGEDLWHENETEESSYRARTDRC